MNMFKKIATAALAVVMAASCTVCFSSCGKKEDVDEGGLKSLVIGGIGPLTGDYANYGTSVRDGVKLAVDEINAAGGVNGYKFVINFEDSQGVPESAVSAYGKLLDDKMKISLGGVFSGECQSIVAVGKEDEIFMLTPSASSDDCIKGNDRAFRVCFSDSYQGAASANYIADNNLATKVAVFYQSDIDYSNGLYNTFKDQCAKRGIEIVTVQAFTASTSTDFSTQIAALKNSGADLIFIPIYAAEATTFLTQAKGKLDGITCFGADGLDGLLEKIDKPENAEGVMLLTPFAADSDKENVQKFVSAYKAAYNSTPDQFAADGYDAIYVIKAAIEKAGIKADSEPDTAEFGKLLADAMTQITVSGVTGTMTWEADGNTQKDAMAMIIRDGVAVAYTAKTAE